MLAHGQGYARREFGNFIPMTQTHRTDVNHRESGAKQSDGGSGKKIICTEERSRRDNALRIALTLDLLKINSIRKKKIIRKCRVRKRHSGVYKEIKRHGIGVSFVEGYILVIIYTQLWVGV